MQVSSRSPGGVMVSTVIWNVLTGCGFNSPSRRNISHFHHIHDSTLLQFEVTLIIKEKFGEI